MPDIDKQLNEIANLIREMPDADMGSELNQLEESIKEETAALKDDAESNKKFNKIQIAKEAYDLYTGRDDAKAVKKSLDKQDEGLIHQKKHNKGAKAARTVILEQNQKILQVLQRGGFGGGTGGGGTGGGGTGDGGGDAGGTGTAAPKTFKVEELANAAKKATGVLAATKNASMKRVSQGRSTLTSNILDRDKGYAIEEALQGDETNTKNLKELGTALKKGDQKEALTKLAKLKETASPELAGNLGLDQVEKDIKGSYGDRVKGAIKGTVFGLEQGSDPFSKEGLKEMFSMENIFGKAGTGGLSNFTPFKETSSAERKGRLEAEQQGIDDNVDFLTPEIGNKGKDYLKEFRQEFGMGDGPTQGPTAAGTGPAEPLSKREKIVAGRTGTSTDDKPATEETLKEVLAELKKGGGVGIGGVGGGDGGPGVMEGVMGGALAMKGKALLGKGKNLLKTGLSKGKGLLRGGARLAAGAARFAGPVAAAASLGYGAFKGGQQAFTKEGLSEFNLEEGEDATLGQKLASGAGGLISGLSFGMFGGDDGNDLSKGLYEFFGGEIKEKIKEEVVDEVVEPTPVVKEDKPALKQTDQQMLDNLASTSIAGVDKGEAFMQQSDEDYKKEQEKKGPVDTEEPFMMDSEEDYAKKQAEIERPTEEPFMMDSAEEYAKKQAAIQGPEDEPFMLESEEDYAKKMASIQGPTEEPFMIKSDEQYRKEQQALQEIEVTAKKKAVAEVVTPEPETITPEEGEEKMKSIMKEGGTAQEAIDEVSQDIGGDQAKANDLLNLSPEEMAAQALKNAKQNQTGKGTVGSATVPKAVKVDTDALFKSNELGQRVGELQAEQRSLTAQKMAETQAMLDKGIRVPADSRHPDYPFHEIDKRQEEIRDELKTARAEAKTHDDDSGITAANDSFDKAMAGDGSFDALLEDDDNFEDTIPRGTGKATVKTTTDVTVTGGGSSQYIADKETDNETSLGLRKQADEAEREFLEAAKKAGNMDGPIEERDGDAYLDFGFTEEGKALLDKEKDLRRQANEAMTITPGGSIKLDADGNEISRTGFGPSINPNVLDTGGAVENMTRLDQEAQAAAAAPIVINNSTQTGGGGKDSTPKIVGVTVEPGVRLAKDSAQLRAQDRRTI